MMGVWVRIFMYMAAGALVNAGVSKEIVAMLHGDEGLYMAVEQGLTLILGLVVGGGALLWRKIALKMGWST